MKALKYLLILLLTALVAKGQLDPLANSSSFQLVDTGITQVVYPVSVGALPSDTISGERGIIWLHGLRGSEQSWGRVSSATESQIDYQVPGYPARKVKSINPDYRSLEFQLIEGAAQGLFNLVESSTQTSILDSLPRNNNFIIAHSQGGLMARSMREHTRENPGLYPSQFNGIVTFGTPHNGAVVLNKTKHGGPLMQWLNAGCYRLGVATITSKISSNWILDVLISQDNIDALTSVSCDVFVDTFLESLVNGFTKPITKDYNYGAQFIDDLNNDLPDSIHKVAFYGVEIEPVLWRTMTSLTVSDTLTSHNPFNMDDDSRFVEVAKQYIIEYHSKQLFYEKQASDWTAAGIMAGILSPIGLVFPAFGVYSFSVADQKEQSAEDFRAAKEWLQNANRSWKKIIGATLMVDSLEGYECICIDQSIGSDVTRIVPTPADCTTQGDESNCFLMGASYNIFQIKKPNDGVVLAESAMQFPGAAYIDFMAETNHQQIRNSFQTKLKLNGLFTGTYGLYFMTLPR